MGNGLIESIADYDRLSFPEACRLYTKATKLEDTERKISIDNVVLGTLYVVVDYVERNGLKLFSNSSFDIDDLLSAFCEEWIKEIRGGVLLKVSSFSQIFGFKFMGCVFKNLGIDEINFDKQFRVTKKLFVEYLKKYLICKREKEVVNFSDVGYEVSGFSVKYLEYFYNKLMPVFENIYNNSELKNMDDFGFSDRFLELYVKLFAYIWEREALLKYDFLVDQTCVLLDMSVEEDFIRDVREVVTNERTMKILEQRFGLDGNSPMTYGEIAAELSVAISRVQTLGRSAIIKLKFEDKIKEYKKYID